jgi:hypothetical protein
MRLKIQSPVFWCLIGIFSLPLFLAAQSLHYGPYGAPRSPLGLPGAEYWQNQADYDLEVELLPEQRRVMGQVIITYTNNSPEPLTYLWLKLDGNLFQENSRGNRTLSADDDRHGSEGVGGFEIVSVNSLNPAYPFGKHYIEDTRMKIDLQEALPAKGGQLRLSIDFIFNLPEYGADRTGWTEIDGGLLFSVAQWYPRMAVLDDRRGWNVAPYLGGGEFYGEFGNFNLEITAPAEYLVIASGTLNNSKEVLPNAVRARYRQAQLSASPQMIIPEEEVATALAKEGTRTWRYAMENTRDVAWVAGNRLVWDGANVRTDGRDIFCQSVYPPSLGGDDAFGQATEYLQACISHYSMQWFPFPYRSMVCVASHVGGIEYPGLTFVPFERRENALWRTVDHEVAHNYFPMWVGSNERSEGWMDEGLVTFLGYYSAQENPPFRSYMSGTKAMRERLAVNAQLPSSVEPDRYHGPGYYEALYFRPAYALIVLREYVLGPDQFDPAFRSYLSVWGGKHPGPADFFRCMENAAGEQLDWFWEDWFFSNAKMDLRLERAERMATSEGWKVELDIVNAGDMRLPTEVRIELEDGPFVVRQIPVEVWLKQDRFTWSMEFEKKPLSVMLDPEGWGLDANRSDQVANF